MALLEPDREFEYLKKAISINPDFKDAWIDLARVSLKKDNIDKAISYLRIAKYIDNSDYRYYYYLGEPFLGQMRITFPTAVDLLMTYKTQIQNLTCIIGRQESKYNAYLNDDRYPILNKQQVNTLAFPTGFANGEDILLIVNGS